ncbi:uncharacterized protein M421DRAFT_291073 [Didymella exigua CBS 183.55]|uniref:Uncharacterized protein n=1 Tax=Didymella exigua CBS 183.55 TaxID=1150837 RepID=A0A6A5RV98_9PLEO|nr:uncharacterized protein M421DRAFT_291073 [Didymella exigua CBS 183.55]KAF1932395.1 hypothetical protein M421DRAFT_291073 [Didymella exigua CBS 183.55]
MAANIPDHYLWLGLGVFTFLAIQHVAQGLRHMRTLTEVHRPAPHPPSTHASRSSDAIKTASLLTLAHSHNIELSLSATTLLCERFYASHSARQLLLRDLGSANERVRRRARLAFRVLRDHGVFGGRGMAHVFPGLEPPDWEHVDVLPAVPRGGLREAVQQEEEERDARRRRAMCGCGIARAWWGWMWMRIWSAGSW